MTSKQPEKGSKEESEDNYVFEVNQEIDATAPSL